MLSSSPANQCALRNLTGLKPKRICLKIKRAEFKETASTPHTVLEKAIKKVPQEYHDLFKQVAGYINANRAINCLENIGSPSKFTKEVAGKLRENIIDDGIKSFKDEQSQHKLSLEAAMKKCKKKIRKGFSIIIGQQLSDETIKGMIEGNPLDSAEVPS